MTRSVSRFQAVVGATLFATIALPLDADGTSLLDILLRAAEQNLLGALMLLVMLGSPQLFGLVVAIAGVTRNEDLVRGPITWIVAVMQGMVVMLAVNLIGAPLVATLGLAGFALVTGLYLPFAAGEAAASSRGGLSLRWYVRWGALLVAGMGLWLCLQMLAGVVLGPAVVVATAAAAVLLASLASADPALPEE